MTADALHITRAHVHLDALDANVRMLRELADGRPLWPAIKANAYGHGAGIVARRLVALGCGTLCVAHAPEAIALLRAGIRARFVLLSAGLPEHADAIVAHDLEPAVSRLDTIEALAAAAGRAGRRVRVHLNVDTGMGRVGIPRRDVPTYLERFRAHPEVSVRGLMSHFPRADEADKSWSLAQLERFRAVAEQARGEPGLEIVHMANSAALFDLPDARFDAVRPGIAIYGLAPSAAIQNPRVRELRPVLEWTTRITLLKEVPADTGLSYGHTFHTRRPSLIATVPVGYGDGLPRALSNRVRFLVRGVPCPQVGNITMDQSLLDVTTLHDRVALGDEVVLLGRRGAEAITAEALAETLGTIPYEVVTRIAPRVPRIAVAGG
jgi:alanine racemase